MLDVWRVKKTNQIVYPMGSVKDSNGYTLCLFPFTSKTNNGYRGVVQSVKNDNLKKDREEL